MDHPPFVCAFRGWNDGGEAASAALRYMTDRWSGRPFGHLDPEEFYDFQVTRPRVLLEGGVSRRIEWPRGEFLAARVQERDVVLFSAAEPNVRWRTYAAALIEAAQTLGTHILVTLGAFLTDVPHTRPVPVVGSALDDRTAARLGLSRSQYEGPTGIVGVLHDAAGRSGLPSISLWAAVPHYLPNAPNPKAALALVRQTCALLEVSVDTAPLERAANTWEEGIVQLIGENDELSEYVSTLEEAADRGATGMVPPTEAEASGRELADEVEKFLREHGGGGPAD
jgi:proteasome assembly chaperone (PAC2) family protein